MRHLLNRGSLALLLALCALSLPLSLAGCAGMLPIVVAASTIAGEVLAWIDRIVAVIDSTAAVDAKTRKVIDREVDRARAAAIALQHAARAGEQADRGEIESAKRDCVEAVRALLDVVQPYGVTSAPDGYGLTPGGHLVVPTPEAMVEGTS